MANDLRYVGPASDCVAPWVSRLLSRMGREIPTEGESPHGIPGIPCNSHAAISGNMLEIGVHCAYEAWIELVGIVR